MDKEYFKRRLVRLSTAAVLTSETSMKAELRTYFRREYLVLFNVLMCFFECLYAFDDIPRTIRIPLRKFREPHKGKEKRDVSDSSPNYRDNLQGRPGQGYYLAVQLGTPPQSVSSLMLY